MSGFLFQKLNFYLYSILLHFYKNQLIFFKNFQFVFLYFNCNFLKIFGKKPMEKFIFQINEDNYHNVVGQFKMVYDNKSQSCLEAVVDYAQHIPQNHAIFSTFIYDACRTHEAFHKDFLAYVSQCKLDDPYCFISFLLVLSDLEKKNLIEKGLVYNALERSGLIEFKEFVAYMKPEIPRQESTDGQTIQTNGSVQESEMNQDQQSLNNFSTEAIMGSINIEIPFCGLLELPLGDGLLENVKNFMSEYHEGKKSFDLDFGFFFYMCIFRNLYFSKKTIEESLRSQPKENIDNIVYAFLKSYCIIEEVYSVVIFYQLVEIRGFLSVFYKFVDTSKPIDRKLLCFLFEKIYSNVQMKFSGVYVDSIAYNPSSNEEEFKTFIDLVDDKVLDEMKKYSLVEDIQSLFDISDENSDDDVLPEDVFEFETAVFSNPVQELDKEKFKKRDICKCICVLGAPSISHFLLVLEKSKQYLFMTEEEQVDFCEIFKSFNEKASVFTDIVWKKMVKFGIIAESVAEKYSESFLLMN